MPILEFLCRQCGGRYEDLVKSAAEAVCPKCGSRRAERLLSTFAVSRGGDRASADLSASGPCGTCGDPRGPGSCDLDAD
jgi:putative FmdB family regulatory protein